MMAPTGSAGELGRPGLRVGRRSQPLAGEELVEEADSVPFDEDLGAHGPAGERVPTPPG